ncbi:MAG: ABC transporter permease subunit [Rhodobacterales bacterium]|nr:ABC transporter permease subunit [Rhodobacterales bacterium]
MTAIVKKERFIAPPVTKLGLVFPGIGHLAVGEWVNGLGLMALVGTVSWAIIAGLPRISDIWFSGPGGGIALHSVVATFSLVAVTAAIWRAAYRRAFPRVMDDEEWNSNRQIFLRTLTRHRTGMMGFYGVCVLLTFTILAPLIAPFDPLAIDVGPQLEPPGWGYLLGTDDYGRDVFSRLLFGARISMSIGFVSVAIAATMGTSIGATAAFFGGSVDRALMWFTDLLLALPRLVLLLAIVGMIQLKGAKSIFLIVAILGFTGWMGVARIVRSQVLSLKQQEFIQAAQALGFSSQRIVFKHLIPNAMAPVIVYCSLAIGATMIAEAGLSFLGLGVPPPIATWGVMVNDGRGPLRAAPWIATMPGLAIVAAVMSFNLFGDGLRDALDPKLR